MEGSTFKTRPGKTPGESQWSRPDENSPGGDPFVSSGRELSKKSVIWAEPPAPPTDFLVRPSSGVGNLWSGTEERGYTYMLIIKVADYTLGTWD